MQKVKEYFLSWSTGIVIFFVGFWFFSYSIFYQIKEEYVLSLTLLFAIWFHIKIQSLLIRNDSFKKLGDLLFSCWEKLSHKFLNK